MSTSVRGVVISQFSSQNSRKCKFFRCMLVIEIYGLLRAQESDKFAQFRIIFHLPLRCLLEGGKSVTNVYNYI